MSVPFVIPGRMICFPSFHTILAVLAAIALWPLPRLRWMAAVWGTLIVVSTVTTGTHYLIDVLAGFAVAMVAQVAARGFSVFEIKVVSPLRSGKWGVASSVITPSGLRGIRTGLGRGIRQDASGFWVHRELEGDSGRDLVVVIFGDAGASTRA